MIWPLEAVSERVLNKRESAISPIHSGSSNHCLAGTGSNGSVNKCWANPEGSARPILILARLRTCSWMEMIGTPDARAAQLPWAILFIGAHGYLAEKLDTGSPIFGNRTYKYTVAASGSHRESYSSMLARVKLPCTTKCWCFHLQLQEPSSSNNQPLLCNHWDGLLKADPKLQKAIRVITQPTWTKTRKRCNRNMTDDPGCSQLKNTPLRTAMRPSIAVRRAKMLCSAVKRSAGLNPAGKATLRKRGRLSVPYVRQDRPACHSLTTLLKASAIAWV